MFVNFRHIPVLFLLSELSLRDPCEGDMSCFRNRVCVCMTAMIVGRVGSSRGGNGVHGNKTHRSVFRGSSGFHVKAVFNA